MKGTTTFVRGAGALLGPKSTINVVLDKSEAEIDVLAIKLRGLLVINAYVHTNLSVKDKQSALDQLFDDISDLIENHNGPAVLGGDSNCPEHYHELLMAPEEAGGEWWREDRCSAIAS